MSALTGFRFWLLGVALAATGGVSAAPLPALKELGAARGLVIGTAVKPEALASEARYRDELLRHFASVTPENAMKIKRLRPTADRWSFEEADIITTFAQKHGLRVRGHTLVWNGNDHSPDWLIKEPATAERASALMSEHITKVMTRYRDCVGDWDVVNEAISNDKRPGASPYVPGYWLAAMGEDYIATAFRFARATDPKARLFYNDYDHGDALSPKSDRIYALLKKLKADGVPVDGVGLQLHCNLQKPPRKADLIANFKRLAALGLLVHVTELDVEIMSAPGPLEERLEKQAAIYRDVFAAAIESGCVEAVTVWGFTDKFRHTAMLRRKKLPPDAATPMWLFDASYRPKSAFHAVVDTLTRR